VHLPPPVHPFTGELSDNIVRRSQLKKEKVEAAGAMEMPRI
jgi:hypothetical protein